MNPVQLTQYIKHGMLLMNISGRGLYDVAVYENFSNETIERPDDIPVVSLSDLGTGGGIAGKIMALQKTYKKILLIVENTPPSYLAPLMQQTAIKGTKLTIIHVSTGLSGIKTAGTAINNDIALAQQAGIAVHGPHDMVQFFQLLEKEGNRYIRVQLGEYMPTLIENIPAENEGGLYSMVSHGLSGSHGTIITGGRVSNELFYACTKLQEMSAMYDCFVATERTWSITDELRDSLLRTEKLIIVADANGNYMKQYAQSKLFESGLYDVEVVVIAPEFDGVTTTQVEYMYDQAGFGIEGFVNVLSL